MTKRSVENDLDELGDHVLGDLNVDERIRMVMKAHQDGREDHADRLVETVPIRTYEVQDLEYRDAVQTCFLLSTHVKHRLRSTYREMCQYENGRDLYVALLMLNEATGFDRDADVEEMVELYGELWDETGLELEADVAPARGPLPVKAKLAYPPEPSALDDETLDELPDDVLDASSQAAFYDLRLTMTTLDFYTVFHGTRRLSEDVIGVTFDEFVGFAPMRPSGDRAGAVEITEEFCRNVLSSYEPYLDCATHVAKGDDAVDDDADVAEVFDGRVKDWVLALVEGWAESGRFPFEEPGRSF